MSWEKDSLRHSLASKGIKTTYECVCNWCPYGFKTEDIMDINDMEYHLIQKHYEKIIDYWIENDPTANKYKAVQMSCILSKYSDYFNNDIVNSPFYDRHDDVEYESKMNRHVADEHWNDFVKYTKDDINNVYWEYAVEFVIDNVCESDKKYKGERIK